MVFSVWGQQPPGECTQPVAYGVALRDLKDYFLLPSHVSGLNAFPNVGFGQEGPGHSGQVITSVFTKLQNKDHVTEALLQG